MPQNPFESVVTGSSVTPEAEPSASNPFMSVVRKRDEDERSAIRASQASSATINPDARAKAMTLAEKTGLPVDTVEKNLQELTIRSGVDRPTPEQLQQRTPTLAAWQADPNNAAISHDDTANMGALEWLVKSPGRAFAQKVNEGRAASLRFKKMFSTLTQDESDQLNAYSYHAKLGGDLGVGDSFFRKAVTGTGRLFAQGVEPAKYAVVGGIETAVVGAAAGSVVPGAGTVSGAVTGFGIGARAGAAYGLVKSTFQQESADAFDEFLDFTDESGKRIDPAVAKVAALGAGAMNAGIELGAAAFVLKRIPGVQKLTGTFTREAVKTALRNPTTRRALMKVAKEYSSNVGAEVATEMAQRAVTILAGDLAKSTEGLPSRPPEDVISDIYREGVNAIPEFAIGIALGHVSGLHADLQRAKTGEQSRQMFEALGEGVAQSETAKRMPGAVQDFVNRAAREGESITEVYVPVESWSAYWQKQKLDPADVAVQVTEDADAWKRAQDAGHLVIPIGHYAAKLAGGEHNAALAYELKVDPTGMNGREADVYREELKAKIEAARQVEAEAGQAELNDAAVAEIERQLIDQAGVPRETARTKAQVLHGITLLSERAGLNPADTWARWGLDVTRTPLADFVASRTAQAGAGAATGTTLTQSEPGAPTVQPGQAGVVGEGVSDLNEIPGLAELEASLGGASIEQVSLPSNGNEINASGESAASAEAMNRFSGMQQRGENFVVYDRAGRRRVLPLADYVDYRPSKGETFGVEGPHGFELREDNGGRVPGESTLRATTRAALQGTSDPVAVMRGPVGPVNEDGLAARFEGMTQPRDGGAGTAVYTIVGGGQSGQQASAEELAQMGVTVPGGGLFFQKEPAADTALAKRQMFYSRLDRAIDESKVEKAKGSQWKAQIKSAKVGVNKDEFALALLGDLDDGTTYSKDDLHQWLRLNRPNIGQVILGEKLAPENEPATVQHVDEEDSEVTEDDLDESDIESRADEIRDEMESAIMDDFDWSNVLGEARAVEDTVEEEVEKEVQAIDPETDEPMVDENGDPVMETVTETEEVTRWIPARYGGEPRVVRSGPSYDRRTTRRGGYREYDHPDDYESYDTEEEAERAAEEWIRELESDDHFREQMYEWVSENVDYGEARRQAIEQLIEEANNEGQRGRSGDGFNYEETHFESYTLDVEQKGDHYREVFITAGTTFVAEDLKQARETLAVEKFQKPFAQLTAEERVAVDDEVEADDIEWRDGHDSYSGIKNPIVRLRLRRQTELEGPNSMEERPLTIKTYLEGSGEGGMPQTEWFGVVAGDRIAYNGSFATREEAQAWIDAQPKPTATVVNPQTFLFLEEVQPPQNKKLGNSKGFELMPVIFQQNWREIAFKWALRYATEQGLAGVAWTTGKQQADRYSLRTRIENITVFKPSEDIAAARGITFRNKNGSDVNIGVDEGGIVTWTESNYHERILGGKHINELVPKEIGDRIMGFDVASPGVTNVIDEKGLIIGGSGLARLYDYDFVNIVNKLPAVKKMGGRVGTMQIVAPRKVEVVAKLANGEEHNRSEHNKESIDHYDVQDAFTDEVLGTADSQADAWDLKAKLEKAPIDHPVLRLTPEMRENILAGQALFQNEQGEVVRGAVEFIRPGKTTIHLFEHANLSTFLHETGHIYLEAFNDIAAQLSKLPTDQLTESQQLVLSDFNVILAHLGVKSYSEIGVEQHELFARSFEAYLMEGRAPSIELREAFSRFRSWLTSIYKNLKALNAPLTDEVRDVFDRMVAGENAVSVAEHEGFIGSVFTTPEQAGMTAEQFALYRQEVERAHIEAVDEVSAELAAEVTRQQTTEYKERLAVVKQEVAAEVYAEPVYRALSAMSRGTTPAGESIADAPMKMSKAILVEQLGKDRLADIPKHLYSREGGLDPALVAEMFGFTSADEMLRKVAIAPPMRAVIKAQTEQRMLAEFGSIQLDGSLPDRARAAAAGPAREKVIRAEVAALSRMRAAVQPFERASKKQAESQAVYERRWFEAETKLRIAMAEGHKQVEIDALKRELSSLKAETRGGASTIRGGIPPTDVVQQHARDVIAGIKLRDLKPMLFWARARQASTKAVEQAARQEFDEAIVSKRDELVALALYREAVRVRTENEKLIAYARRIGTPESLARIAKAGVGYHDQVAGILDRFDFAKVPQRVLDRRTAIDTWVKGLESAGIPVTLPTEVLTEARRTNYQNLTHDEIVGITDGLKMIVHLSQLKNKLLKAEKKRQLGRLVQTLANTIRENKGVAPEDSRDRNAATERRRSVRGILAAHRKLASIVREMDGWKDGGPVWNAIQRPLNDAAAQEAVMLGEAGDSFKKLVDKAFPRASKRQLYVKTFVPEVGRSMSKMEMITVALNWGNAGNRDRILSFEKWNESQVAAVINRLTKSEMDFVQGVFDLIGGYWPAIVAKHERLTGLRLKKVEASPINHHTGVYRGGYYPLVYDSRLSASAAQMIDLNAANLAKIAAFSYAQTDRGHEQARVEHYDRPVRYDFGVITEHIQQVVHDLTHHEALIDIGRVMAAREFQDAVYERFGDLTYKTMKDTIRDVAFGELPAATQFESALNHVRIGSTVVGLGWNMTTAMLQPLGMLPTFTRVGAFHVVKGLGRFLGTPKRMQETVDWIYELSPMMQERSRTMSRELNEIRNNLGVYDGKFKSYVEDVLRATTFNQVTQQGIADSFFYFIGKAQQTVDVPTWLGAFEQAKANDANISDKDAAAIADQTVLDTQGGGQVKDLASVQRGGPLLKLWTNFYSYFNVLYNNSVEVTKRVNPKDPFAVGRLAVDYVLIFIAPAILGDALRKIVRGDDEEWTAAEFARGVASYMMGTVLGLRELAGAVQGYAGYQGPAGTKGFTDASRLIQQSGQYIGSGFDAEQLDAAFFRSLNDTAGALFHFPAGQVRRTVEGFSALAEGRTENPLVLVTGPER